jgi:hypothetical protein
MLHKSVSNSIKSLKGLGPSGSFPTNSSKKMAKNTVKRSSLIICYGFPFSGLSRKWEKALQYNPLFILQKNQCNSRRNMVVQSSCGLLILIYIHTICSFPIFT